MIVFDKAVETGILEVFYILVGLISVSAAWMAVKDEKNSDRIPTMLFWALLGIIFMFGPFLNKFYVGLMIIVMGVLTATKQVKTGVFKEVTKETRQERADRLKNGIFIPALTIAFVALICSKLIKTNGALIGLGLGSVLAIIVALIVTKAPAKMVPEEGGRLLQQVSTSAILPQLLAALGSVFAAAKVGDVISGALKSVIPADNIFIGIAVYCIGMAVFTIIMGNAFAAFTVITAGIGVPFVLSQGVNPVIAGAVALTAGYCGTLLTPMAANFNIVPAAVLETKNKYRVIIEQSKLAVLLLIIHIFLMYYLGYVR